MSTPGVRQSLSSPVSASGALLAGGLAGACITLEALGQRRAAVAVLVVTVLVSTAALLLGRLRTPGVVSVAGTAVRTHRLQETIRLRHPPEKAWSLIYPAEHAPLLSPDVTRGYRLPGTPEGVGEQQALVGLDGVTHVVEVIEYAANRRAVIKFVSPATPVPVRLVYELEPLVDGCLYTLRQEYDAAPHQGWSATETDAWRRRIKDSLERVRLALATWEEPSATTQTITPG